MCRSSDTVIIYFARSASEDLKKNRFSGKGLHRSLIDRLHRHSLKTIRSTELPVLFFDEENQVGNNLAERLTHAFSEAFAKGYKNVIALGNDTPDLNADDLKLAAAALASGGSVLGPSADGGNYLIGIGQKDFDRTAFCAALKDAQHTHRELKKRLDSPLELEIRTDIDDEKSLLAWLASIAPDAAAFTLRKAILTICSSTFESRDHSEMLSDLIQIAQLQDRAPPVAA